jgi:hypothetical protein
MVGVERQNNKIPSHLSCPMHNHYKKSCSLKSHYLTIKAPKKIKKSTTLHLKHGNNATLENHGIVM